MVAAHAEGRARSALRERRGRRDGRPSGWLGQGEQRVVGASRVRPASTGSSRSCTAARSDTTRSAGRWGVEVKHRGVEAGGQGHGPGCSFRGRGAADQDGSEPVLPFLIMSADAARLDPLGIRRTGRTVRRRGSVWGSSMRWRSRSTAICPEPGRVLIHNRDRRVKGGLPPWEVNRTRPGRHRCVSAAAGPE